jgi:hypothetical protein
MLFSLGPENPSGREEKDDEYEHKTGSCGCRTSSIDADLSKLF